MTNSDDNLTLNEQPDHLTPGQENLWNELVSEYGVKPEDFPLVEALVIQVDRSRQAARAIKRQGLIIQINNKATTVVHPAVKVERDAQILAAKLLKELRAKYSNTTNKTRAKSPRLEKLDNGDLTK